MATTTTNFGWDIPQSTDLVKDGATAIATLGQDIDTAFVDLKGGTTGQVLSKASGTDLDFTWVAPSGSNAILNTIVDAKGDLIGATAADTPARLAVGADGTFLKADSTAATGLAWGSTALTLVKSQTIGSGVTSVAVTGAFSSTYDSYLILITGGVASGNCNLNLQLGSTTTGYYRFGFYGYASSTTITGDNTNNGSSFLYAGCGSTNNLQGNCVVQSPNLPKYTNLWSNNQRMNTADTIMGMNSGFQASTTQFTDFTIIADGGANLTGGTIKVYGYGN